MKKEYLLPNIVAELLREDRINVKVLETHDKWFGVTYAEDKEYVQNAFKQLIENGVYPEKLWKQDDLSYFFCQINGIIQTCFVYVD